VRRTCEVDADSHLSRLRLGTASSAEGSRGLDDGRDSRAVMFQSVLTLADVALNTLSPHPDYVGIICTRAVGLEAWSM
jgi:hypothetical protein